MKFVVHCLDAEGQGQRRLDAYEAHKAYLAEGSVRTVISGPLLASDASTMIGSLFVLEAETLAEVEAFNAADPFRTQGIWERVSIHPFLLRVDNRD
jgi:uncharacterized protein